jgi:hypothetical protein
LLRSTSTLAGLHEGATDDIHSAISKTADAYEEAAGFSSVCTAATYHARFLRGLVAQDIFKARQVHGSNSSPAMSSPPGSSISRSSTATYHGGAPQPGTPSVHASGAQYGLYAPPQEPSALAQAHPHSYGVPMVGATENAAMQQPAGVMGSYPQGGADVRYWDQMFRDIGFAGCVDAANEAGGVYASGTGASTYGAAPGVYAYQYMQSDAVGYPT